MFGAERGSSSAMRMRIDWRTLGEWVRQPAPAQAGPGIGPVLLVALLSFLALVAVLLAPIRGATRAPIGAVLAAE